LRPLEAKKFNTCDAPVAQPVQNFLSVGKKFGVSNFLILGEEQYFAWDRRETVFRRGTVFCLGASQSSKRLNVLKIGGGHGSTGSPWLRL